MAYNGPKSGNTGDFDDGFIQVIAPPEGYCGQDEYTVANGLPVAQSIGALS